VIHSLAGALFQRAQGLGERALEPGEVVGLAVMMRRELVGPADRSVPDVFAGTIADAGLSMIVRSCAILLRRT
jgi:hypothetical protein